LNLFNKYLPSLVTFETDDNYSIRFEMKNTIRISHSTSYFITKLKIKQLKSRAVKYFHFNPLMHTIFIWVQL